MKLLDKLRNNKGTVSSKLGKELAMEVLNGNNQLLEDAVSLVTYDLKDIRGKNIRAGAAKIVEKVAEKNPEKVSRFLSDLLPALEAEEPQTRWMIIMTFGYCASLNTSVAEKGIIYAGDYIREQKGVCLSGAAELYLGYMGTLSKSYANQVFPILVEACDNALMNEIDWIFEAFIRIGRYMTEDQKKVVLQCVQDYSYASKKSTQKRREKLLRLLERQ